MKYLLWALGTGIALLGNAALSPQASGTTASFDCGRLGRFSLTCKDEPRLSPGDGFVDYAFDPARTKDRKPLLSMIVSLRFIQGGQWRVDARRGAFPFAKTEERLFAGTGQEVSILDVDGNMFTLGLPAGTFIEIQDNRRWNWSVFECRFHLPAGASTARVTCAVHEATGPRKKLLDAFGQVARAFPGKISSEDELRADVTNEAAFYASCDFPGALARETGLSLDAYGGLAGTGARLGLRKTGFFHVEKRDGRWWFVDPEGNAFFRLGICAFVPCDDFTDVTGREDAYAWLPPRTGAYAQAWLASSAYPNAVSHYRANLVRKYGSCDPVETAVRNATRVRRIGFNAMGAFAGGRREAHATALPYVRFVPLGGVKRIPAARGLFDPFDEASARAVERAMEKVRETADDPLLLGYYLENEQAFEDLPRAISGMDDTWAAKRAFTASGTNMAAFVEIFLERYYSLIERHFRANDPNHLLIGNRWQPVTARNETLCRVAGRHLDVVSVNYYAHQADPAFARQIYEWSGGRPQMWSEFFYSAGLESNAGPFTYDQPTQRERGRAYGRYLAAAANLEFVAGIEWFALVDQSATGRFFQGVGGENFNNGLLSVTDRPYRDLWEEMLVANLALYRRLLARPRAAILDAGFPSGTNAWGAASDPAVFERALADGWTTRRLTPAQLADGMVFNRNSFDLLVVPCGSWFPAAATNALLAFLSSGGNLFTTGGYAFDSLKGVNTRFTPQIRDCQRMGARQIGVFDPSHRFSDVVRVETDPDVRGILPDVSFRGPLAGWAATAVLTTNGHGSASNMCAWQPILRASDRAGRLAGEVGALVRHVDGCFAGSSWAVFGADDRDLFADGAPCTRLIRPVADSLVQGLILARTTTDYACYRRGETVTFSACVRNAACAERRGCVRFTVADDGGNVVATREVTFRLDAGSVQTVKTAWTVPADAPDFYRFTSELLADNAVRAREQGGLVVWDEAVQARGPTVALDGLRFVIDGRPGFYMGAQAFWGQLPSTTARSPLKMREDFAAMRAHGLRITRLFLRMDSEQAKRFSDACVQLAQKCGLVIYHTPNLGATAEPRTLGSEKKTMAEIASRYAAAPGLMIDICNEPQFNEGISKRSMEKMRAWASECRAAAKAVRPDLPVSIGWMQRWGDRGKMFDPPFVSRDLDFTDQHFYNDLRTFTAEMKEADLRALGKPLIVGECGGKEHPTFVAGDPWNMGETPESFTRRFVYLTAHAAGQGATALLAWHWRDPLEGLFPCGLVHGDGVPRAALATFEKMARALGKLDPVDNPPDVAIVLREEPRWTTNRMVYVKAARRLDPVLSWWGANWSKVTESDVPRLGPEVKLRLDPESLPTDEAALRAAIGEKLLASGTFFTRRSEDPLRLRTFRMPGRGMTGWLFWNGEPVPVKTVRGGQTITIRPNHAGFLLVASDGSCLVREEF